MNKILITLMVLFLVEQKDQVKITFNSGEEKQYANLNDVLNLQFLPSREEPNAKYKLHNVTVAFQGYSGSKEIVKQRPISLKDEAPTKAPVVKIALKDYLKKKELDWGVEIFIDVESVQKINNGQIKVVSLPKSQLHRSFPFSKDKD